jgi:hypothetical protein
MALKAAARNGGKKAAGSRVWEARGEPTPPTHNSPAHSPRAHPRPGRFRPPPPAPVEHKYGQRGNQYPGIQPRIPRSGAVTRGLTPFPSAPFPVAPPDPPPPSSVTHSQPILDLVSTQAKAQAFFWVTRARGTWRPGYAHVSPLPLGAASWGSPRPTPPTHSYPIRIFPDPLRRSGCRMEQEGLTGILTPPAPHADLPLIGS